MKKFKKAMALSLALAMGLSLVACGKEEKKDDNKDTTTEATTTAAEGSEDATTAAEGGEETTEAATLPMPAEDSAPIYCYSWNTEFGDRLNYVKEKYPQYADLIQYENLGLGGGSDEYKTAIENALAAGGEKVPSIVAMDDALALYFLSSDYIVPVEDLGITPDMYKNAYDYTINYATIDGKVKGLTWQATPGCFIYRTDIAEKVLGVTEPDEVQEYVKDWDTFLATAQTMKDAGYAMLSGCDDAKYPFFDKRSQGWVVDDTFVCDQAIIDYLEFAKKLYDGDFTKKSAQWDDNWNTNFTADVFGYFGCTWFVYWSINDSEGSETYGKRRACQGPNAYHWGGTYLGVSDQCPNKELAALVLYTLTCDTDVMYKLSEETLDFVNNQEAVAKLIADGKGDSPVLGGQNPLVTFDAAAKLIDLSAATEYDSTINGYLDNISGAYNSGEYADVDAAVEALKKQVRDGYSYLTVE